MLAKGYQKACAEYDFEKNASKIGMLMTIDGTMDDLILPQGFDTYTFTDADGGDDRRGSSADESETDSDSHLPAKAKKKKVPKQKPAGGGPAAAADKDADDDHDDDEGSISVSSEGESDDVDDTAEVDAIAALGVGSAVCPEGFTIEATLMPFGDLTQQNALIGKAVLFKWNGAPLPPADFGWYLGWVKKRATPAEIARVRKETGDEVNFMVSYSNRETNDRLPFFFEHTAKWAEAEVSLGLTADVWGPTAKWVVVTPPGDYQRPKMPKRNKGGGKEKKKKE